MLPNVTYIFASGKDGSKIKGRIGTELEQLADNKRGQLTVIYLNFLYGNNKRGNNYFEKLFNDAI